MTAVEVGAAAARPGTRGSTAERLLDHHLAILELISRAAPLAELLDAIVVRLEDLLEGSRCSILLLDRGAGRLRHGAAPSLPAAYCSSIDGLRIGPSAGSCGTAAWTGRRVVVEDVEVDPRWTDFLDAAHGADLRACWSSPILGSDGRPVGTFAVYHRDPHRPTADELALIDRFTHLAAVAIGHSRLVGDLVESETRFRTWFEGSALGSALVGLDHRLEQVNDAFLDLVGRPGSLLVGSPLAPLLPGEEVEAALGSLASGERARVTIETRLHTPRGGVPVSATFSLLHDARGAPTRVGVALLDLTEREAAEAARRERQEAEVAGRTAAEHSRAKSALLAAVGHEIRTPLQAITGFVELLRTLDLDPDRRDEALTRIGRGADHVLELVQDVLEISRIEADDLPVERVALPVAVAVADAVALLEPEAVRRGVTVRQDVAGGTGPPLEVLADRRRLRQVLLNLVSNAIRHGRAGGTVVVRAAAGSDVDGPWVRLEVQDDGPGIPEEFVPMLLSPLQRWDQRAGRGDDVRGHGLGLVLTHGLASAMGGELSVSSTPGHGATMTVRLPGVRV